MLDIILFVFLSVATVDANSIEKVVEFKTCLEIKEKDWQTLDYCEGTIPNTEHDICPIYCFCGLGCFDNSETQQACKFNTMVCYDKDS
jgi:hypothetical protein